MKIIISVAVAIFLIGCSEDSTTSSPQKEIFKQVTKEAEPVMAVEDKEPAIEVAPVSTKSGAQLFKVCSSCHGVNGEKKALNKSQVIQGWSEVQTSTALNGYKDGSYGGAMKGLMKSQVTKLSDEDIAVLAKHISGL